MSSSVGAASAARAVKWSAFTTVARFALQLGAQVALARMLGPGNFGVYGIGMVVFTFATFLSGSRNSSTMHRRARKIKKFGTKSWLAS